MENDHTEQDKSTLKILTIAGGHFINDSFMAFIPALLPLLIQKLSLSLTTAGTLSAIAQLPAVLNPMIGYVADRHRLQWAVILSPGITATMISLLGIAPNEPIIAFLILFSGLSTAFFHAPAPAMVGNLTKKRLGRAMSWFMAGGEFGYSIGPLLAVWAVSTFTLEGTARMMVIGWAASALLYWQLHRCSTHMLKSSDAKKAVSVKAVLPELLRFFTPMSLMLFMRSFITTILVVYLPTYMNKQGANLWMSGASLSILEFAGVIGALVAGSISDCLGRKSVLVTAFGLSFICLVWFLNSKGGELVIALLLLGFTTIATGPIYLAIVQENFPHHRAVANGIYMGSTFLLTSLTTLIIGIMGDHIGLERTFLWSGIISLLAIPAVFLLPNATHDETQSVTSTAEI